MSFTSGLGSGLGATAGQSLAPHLVAALGGGSNPTTLSGRLAAAQASTLRSKQALSGVPVVGIACGALLGGFILFVIWEARRKEKPRQHRP